MLREQVIPETLYWVEDSQSYFVSPNGEGGYWYDNMEEVDEAYGRYNFPKVVRVATLSDF